MTSLPVAVSRKCQWRDDIGKGALAEMVSEILSLGDWDAIYEVFRSLDCWLRVGAVYRNITNPNPNPHLTALGGRPDICIFFFSNQVWGIEPGKSGGYRTDFGAVHETGPAGA